MSVYSCLNGVIGFTRKEDFCVDGYDASYAESDSGLYIDELPGMSLRILNSVGGKSDIWDKMTYAKENAINAFKIDVIREILKTKEPARPTFKGDIGGKSFTSVMSSDTYHGLRMYSDITGGSFTLRGVTLILNTTEAVTLDVYTGDDDEDGASAIASFSLTSLAGRPKYNAVTATEFDLEGDLYFLFSATGLPYNKAHAIAESIILPDQSERSEQSIPNVSHPKSPCKINPLASREVPQSSRIVKSLP